MGQTSTEVRRRIRSVGIRIAELQASGATRHPVLAATLSDLQAEQAAWKLLLTTRRLQLQDKVISLARWRDGFTVPPPRAAMPALPPPAPERPRRSALDRRAD